MKKVWAGLLTCCLLAGISSVSQAFIPITGLSDRNGGAEVSRGEGYPIPVDSWLEYMERYGGGWKIEWDDQRGSPHAIYGSSIEIYPGIIPNGEAVSSQLLSLIDTNSELFGISSDDLLPIDTRLRGKLWYANFQQIINSLPVYGGFVQFKLRRDGKLVSITSRAHRGIGPVASPVLPAQRALSLAMAETFFVEGRDRAMEPQLVVYPHAEDGRMTYTTSWMIELHTLDPPGHWFTVIDAVNGRIVDTWNQIYYDEVATDSISGTVTGLINPETPTDPSEEQSFKDLRVQLLAGGSDVTDASGGFLLETEGPDSILAWLQGPFVNVDKSDGADAALRIEGIPGVPNDILWDDTNSEIPERNGFYHTIVVHDYVKELDSTFTDLDYEMPCRVNLDQVCNAFWDGFGTNFFQEGGGCANTANIADVIYHEYGHGVTDFQYRPFPQPSGAMHEGLSDYLAATITNQSLIGRGFFGPGSSIRNADNNRVYPAPECGGEPHCVGEAIAGAVWDMRQNLVATLGQEAGVALADTLFHYARYGYSEVFPDYFIDVLTLDDDDGNLFNGVPHADEICDGFQNHGLSCVLTPNIPIVYDVGSGTDLQVAWQAVLSLLAPVSDYLVLYGSESGVYMDSSWSGGDTTVVVTDLEEGLTYFFTLAALDSTGRRSLLSEEGTGTPYSLPLPPEGVAAESHRDDISLTWMKNKELDVDAYVILRSVHVDSGYTGIDTIPAADTTYTDTTPDPHMMYFYRIAARDTEGGTGQPSEITRGRLMSLDSGILIVDGTHDGQDGLPFSYSDSTVDNFYGRILDHHPVTGYYDIADSVGTSLFMLDESVLAIYSTVVWHQDDRMSDLMIPYLDDIGTYLSEGGNLFLSGWNLIKQVSDHSLGTYVFPPGTVPHDYFKMDSTEVLQSSIRDFAGADAGVADYPDLLVDSDKAPWLNGYLFNMDIFFEPLVDQPVTEPIYTYRSADGDSGTYSGEITGFRYLGEDYGFVLFDFPLFYMEEASARAAIEQAMEDLGEMVGIEDEGETGSPMPHVFALYQNYPNPFNPSTSIIIDIPERGDGSNPTVATRTRLTIHNMRGQLVRVLLDDMKKPGRYTIHWDGRNERGESVSSGLYLYRMKAGDYVFTKKMVVLK